MTTYKFKLYRSKKNKQLHQQINIAGYIYNHLIALHKRYYKYFKKYPSKYNIQKFITRLKKQHKFQFWNTLGSQAIQQVVERIDFGYKKFFHKENKRPPAFRKIKRFKSFTLKQAGWKLFCDNSIQIGKEFFRYSKSRSIEGNIKTVTIKRDTLGHCFIFITTDHQETSQNRIMTGKSAGFDFGLKTFLVGSDGSVIRSPLFFKHGLKRIRKASQNLSSKAKGSNNRKKARMHLARVHKKIANQRLDFHFKLAKELTEKYDYIFLETLNLAGMKKLWGRKVSDLGFAQFVNILHYQASKIESVVHHIDRWFPSSKMCSDCCFVNKELQLEDRAWTCPHCGTVHDRDFNASTNIEREGASSLWLGDVRPCESMAIAV